MRKTWLFLIAALGTVLFSLYACLTSSWFICGAVLPIVGHFLGADVTAESVSLSFLNRHLSVSHLAVGVSDAAPVATLEQLDISFSLSALCRGDFYFHDVKMDKLNVIAIESEDGDWNFPLMWNFQKSLSNKKKSMNEKGLHRRSPFQVRTLMLTGGSCHVQSRNGMIGGIEDVQFSWVQGRDQSVTGGLRSDLSFWNRNGTAFRKIPLRMSLFGSLDSQTGMPDSILCSLSAESISGMTGYRAVDSHRLYVTAAFEFLQDHLAIRKFQFESSAVSAPESGTSLAVCGTISTRPDTPTVLNIQAGHISSNAVRFLNGYLIPDGNWGETSLTYQGTLTVRQYDRFILNGVLTASDMTFRYQRSPLFFPHPLNMTADHQVVWEPKKEGCLLRFNVSAGTHSDTYFVFSSDRFIGMRAVRDAITDATRWNIYKPESAANSFLTQPDPLLRLQINRFPLSVFKPFLKADSSPFIVNAGTASLSVEGAVGDRTLTFKGKGGLSDVGCRFSIFKPAPLDLSLSMTGDVTDMRDFNIVFQALSLTSTGNPFADVELTCSRSAAQKRTGGTYAVNTYPIQLQSLIPAFRRHNEPWRWFSNPLIEQSAISLTGTYMFEKNELRAFNMAAALTAADQRLIKADFDLFPALTESTVHPVNADMRISPDFIFAVIPSDSLSKQVENNLSAYLLGHEIRMGASGEVSFLDSVLRIHSADMTLLSKDTEMSPFPARVVLKNGFELQADTMPFPAFEFSFSGYDRAQYAVNFIPDAVSWLRNQTRRAVGDNAMLKWDGDFSVMSGLRQLTLRSAALKLYQDGTRTVNADLKIPITLPLRDSAPLPLIRFFIIGTVNADSTYVFLPETSYFKPSGGQLSANGILEYACREARLSVKCVSSLTDARLCGPAGISDSFNADARTDLGFDFLKCQTAFRKWVVTLYGHGADSSSAPFTLQIPQTHLLRWTAPLRGYDRFLLSYHQNLNLPLRVWLQSHGMASPFQTLTGDGQFSLCYSPSEAVTLSASLSVDTAQLTGYSSDRVFQAASQFQILPDSTSYRVASFETTLLRNADTVFDMSANARIYPEHTPERNHVNLRTDLVNIPALIGLFKPDTAMRLDSAAAEDSPGLGICREFPGLPFLFHPSDIHWTAADIRYAEQRSASVVSVISLKNHLVDIREVAVAHPGGAFEGLGRVNLKPNDGYPFWFNVMSPSLRLELSPQMTGGHDIRSNIHHLRCSVKGKGFTPDNLARHFVGILAFQMTDAVIPYGSDNIWVKLLSLPLGLSLNLNPLQEMRTLFKESPKIAAFKNAELCVTAGNGTLNFENVRFREGSAIQDLAVTGQIDIQTANLRWVSADVILNSLTTLSFVAGGTVFNPHYSLLSSAGKTMLKNVGNAIDVRNVFEMINPFEMPYESGKLTEHQKLLFYRLKEVPPELLYAE